MRRIWSELAPALGGAVLWAGCGTQELNGCEPSAALDARQEREIEIGFGGVHGYHYVPACLRVRAGTRLRFAGPFEVHPLGVGAFEDGRVLAAPESPLHDTAAGSEATFVLSEPGSYGFFCHHHVGEGMAGAVFVE